MATEKLYAEIDCKSNADKLWVSFRDFIHVYQEAFPPGTYKSVQVLEGDGVHPGSIRLRIHGEGSPIAMSKEKIESLDEENKILSFSVIEGDILKYFKSFKITGQVVPKDEGCLVKWSCEYEKAADNIPDPIAVKDFSVKGFKELDDYTAKQA
ncbi:MLP-like protein 423 [Humulus lupulus]|uniref:MLP-like protein 423 n=1 Tax=Humulus lupulus TaxID=3486 RepID=UPI002B418335|nr:MLP-like protein 423 [Humulus lupulus]